MNRLAEWLNKGLEQAGVLVRSETGTRHANLLLGALEETAERAGGTWRAPVIVVDGLDEARDRAFDIATDLLVRLGRWCTVIVSTRNLPALTDTGTDLLTTLGPPTHRLPLAAGEIATRGRDAIGEYVTERLTGMTPSMDPAAVASYFLASTDAVAGQPFLIARLMTDQLRAAPVDTGVDGWQTRISTSVRQALLADLAEVGPPEHRPNLQDPARLARNVLAALTWSSLSEATNTHVRALTKRADGYHSPEALIAMAMLTRGGFTLVLPGRKH